MYICHLFGSVENGFRRLGTSQKPVSLYTTSVNFKYPTTVQVGVYHHPHFLVSPVS